MSQPTMDDKEKVVLRAIQLSPAPLSVNEEERTVEMVIATEAPVNGLVLRCSADAIITSPVVSILLDHENHTSAMAGRLVSCRAENGQLLGVAQFKDAPAAETGWQLARAGCPVSVRAMYKLDDVVFGTGTSPDVATRWRMGEVSLTPIGADYTTTTRSAVEEPPTMKHEGRDNPMAEPNLQVPPAAEAPGAEAQPSTAATETRAAAPAPALPVEWLASLKEIPLPPAVDAEQVRSGERNRVTGILDACRKAGLDATFSERLITDGTSIDQARAAIIDAMAERQASQPQTLHGRVEVGTDHSEKRMAVMEAGLMARAGYGDWSKDGASECRGLSLVDYARDCLELRGVSHRGMTVDEVVTRALHGTTDFPLLLASVQRVSLKAGYAQERQTWQPMARKSNLPDFRPSSLIEVGGQLLPEALQENGEYKSGTIKEAGGSWKIDEFAKKVNFARKFIINDNLGYVTEALRIMGAGVAVFEANRMWGMLTSGGANGLGDTCMMDGKFLFHADHNNTVTGAIGETSFSDARQKMRNQKSFDGTTPLYVVPTYVLLPTTLETTFEKFNATIMATKTGDVNVFSGKLQPIVEPRLDVRSTSQFYIVGEYPGVDKMVYGYLEGEDGPTIDSEATRSPDGITVYLRHTFGSTIVQHQAFIRSSGQ